MEKELDLYCSCLNELNGRIKTIRDLYAKTNTTGWITADTECMALQMRKMIEQIALLSLVGDKDQYTKITRHFATDWRVGEIFSRLQRINERFYPQPLIRQVDEEKKIDNTYPLKTGYLTKEEAIEALAILNPILHAEHPAEIKGYEEDLNKKILFWTQRVIKLLNLHETQLAGRDVFVLGSLQAKGIGKPLVLLYHSSQLADVI